MFNERQVVGKNVFWKVEGVDGWVLFEGPWFEYLDGHCGLVTNYVTLLVTSPEFEKWVGDDPEPGMIFPVDEFVWEKVRLYDHIMYGFWLRPDGSIPDGRLGAALTRRAVLFNTGRWRAN